MGSKKKFKTHKQTTANCRCQLNPHLVLPLLLFVSHQSTRIKFFQSSILVVHKYDQRNKLIISFQNKNKHMGPTLYVLLTLGIQGRSFFKGQPDPESNQVQELQILAFPSSCGSSNGSITITHELVECKFPRPTPLPTELEFWGWTQQLCLYLYMNKSPTADLPTKSFHLVLQSNVPQFTNSHTFLISSLNFLFFFCLK